MKLVKILTASLIMLFSMSSLCVWGAIGSGSAGCGMNPPYPLGTSTNDSITTVDGLRTFRVFLPSIYNMSRPTAVVFHLHGATGSGLSAELGHRMDPVAQMYNFIIVYPDGLYGYWNAGSCCSLAHFYNIDDVGFISGIIDYLEGLLCIETTQIFATGMSNGALMSHRLGCELSDRIAAIAPVEGGLEFLPCTPTNPMPVFEIHGTNDTTIPLNGGFGCGSTAMFNFTAITYTIDVWIGINQCNCPSFAEGESGACGTVVLVDADGTCVQFGTCQGGNVTFCLIEGGGHGWPGGFNTGGIRDSCDSTCGTFDASLNIWNFFAAVAAQNFADDDTVTSSPSTDNDTVTSSSSSAVRLYSSFFLPLLLSLWEL
jgi:polyhydroxybutyrate depolymerase